MIIAILLVQLKEQKNSRELTGTVTGNHLVGIDPKNCVHFPMFQNNFWFLTPATKLGKVIFSEACVKNSVRKGWYPSMHCRSPGPHLGGKLRGLALGGGCLQAHTRGGGGGIPACTEADHPADSYCCRRYTSYWNAFLFKKYIYSIRCRNGFNRRDEAIKHYRTHFRNPQTTFQIQIAQVAFRFQEGSKTENIYNRHC